MHGATGAWELNINLEITTNPEEKKLRKSPKSGNFGFSVLSLSEYKESRDVSIFEISGVRISGYSASWDIIFSIPNPDPADTPILRTFWSYMIILKTKNSDSDPEGPAKMIPS